MRKLISLFILLFLSITPTYAEDTPTDPSPYIKPTWPDFVNMLISFNALNFKDDTKLLDEYIMLNHCDWYTDSHNDEFQWQKIRNNVLSVITKAPTNAMIKMRYQSTVHLDKYDFDDKIFHFTKNGNIDHVNAFLITNSNQYVCDNTTLEVLPHNFRVVLNKPIILSGLPMDQETGEALLKSMELTKNKDRTVFIKFNMRIVNIQSIGKYEQRNKDNKITYYYLQGRFPPDPTQLDGELDSAEFYADPEMTIKIYTYTP
jgi:hypothetical protein